MPTVTVAASRGVPQVVLRGAACRDADAELFFAPDDSGNHHNWRPEPAIAVCYRCPVRRPCRAYALGIRGLHGVWGGLTEGQRDARQGWKRS